MVVGHDFLDVGRRENPDKSQEVLEDIHEV